MQRTIYIAYARRIPSSFGHEVARVFLSRLQPKTHTRRNHNFRRPVLLTLSSAVDGGHCGGIRSTSIRIPRLMCFLGVNIHEGPYHLRMELNLCPIDDKPEKESLFFPFLSSRHTWYVVTDNDSPRTSLLKCLFLRTYVCVCVTDWY